MSGPEPAALSAPVPDVAAVDDSLREAVTQCSFIARRGLEQARNGYRDAAEKALEDIARRMPESLVQRASSLVPDVAAERVAAWQEVDPHHVVSTGERVRCERNDTTDLAVEFTVAEELDGEHIESLFHPVDPRKRYYTVRAAALTTEQSAALAGTDEAGQS